MFLFFLPWLFDYFELLLIWQLWDQERSIQERKQGGLKC